MITSSNLIAFHGDNALKSQCFKELENAAQTGLFVRENDLEDADTDWEAPLLQDYVDLEHELGIPVWFLMLTEWLACQLPVADGSLWAARIVQAIEAGSNLDQVWPRFACSLLSSGQDSLLSCVNGTEQQSLITTLYTLQTFKDVDSDSFEKKALLALRLCQGEFAAQPASAMWAASWIAYASYFGAHGGDYARAKAARAVLCASRQTARTMTAGLVLPVMTMAQACAIQAQALLEIIEDRAAAGDK